MTDGDLRQSHRREIICPPELPACASGAATHKSRPPCPRDVQVLCERSHQGTAQRRDGAQLLGADTAADGGWSEAGADGHLHFCLKKSPGLQGAGPSKHSGPLCASGPIAVAYPAYIGGTPLGGRELNF